MPAPIQFTYEDDEGDEVTVDLPSRNEVCSRCEGEGRILHPDIGNHAYSQEEFNDTFTDDDKEEYFKGGHGIYGVSCHECNGRRVVAVVDRSRVNPDALERYENMEADDAEYEALCAAERRMGA